MIKIVWNEVKPIVGFTLAIGIVVVTGLYWAAKNSGWV